MSTHERNTKTEQNKVEFDLRDLIIYLWRHKIIVIIITLIFTIAASIISNFLLTPTYTTTFTIATNIPSAYNTKYGEFSSPINNNIDYLNLIKSNEVIEQTITDLGYNIEEVSFESMSSRIIIGEVDPAQNVFLITVTGSDPNEIVQLSNTLYDNFIDHVGLIVKDRAINHFYNDFTIKLDSDKSSLKSTNDLLVRYEELISTCSVIIDQEELLEVLSDTSDYMFLQDALNPNYIELETNIIETKKAIETLASSIELNTSFLDEITSEKEALDKFYLEGGSGSFETSFISTSDVFILSEAIVPSEKTSPNIGMNTLIGGVGGFFIGILVVFFKGYWMREI